jgi:hypothetical protein
MFPPKELMIWLIKKDSELTDFIGPTLPYDSNLVNSQI